MPSRPFVNMLRTFFGVFFNFMRKRELNVQRLPLKKLASLVQKRYAGAFADYLTFNQTE